MSLKHFVQRLTCILFLLLFSHTAMASDGFLVDSDWLGEHIDDDRLVILEVRYHPHRYHTVGHIEGAVQVQRFRDLGDNEGNPLMRFPSREAFQDTLRRYGVNDDSTLLLYDDSRTALASRLYFLLALYGFPMEQVKMLDGGTIEWTAFEELSTQPTVPEPGTVTLKEADASLMVEWTAIYDDVVSRRDPNVVLLDSRPGPMYTGEVIQNSIQGGHIPGAINVVSLDGTDAQTQTWVDDEHLAAMYSMIPKDSTVYVYCHDGFRMSLAWMQLKHLGYEDVRLYNGGWSHWGNSLTLPVVTGDQPWDEEYSL
jgi:thiosulfate/3-mercaptopyruvate sulfurtransferase